MSIAVENVKKENKKLILYFYEDMDKSPAERSHVLEKYFAKDVVVNITSPFEEMTGISDFDTSFWKPLIHSFPDMENQPYILMEGSYEDRDYVSSTGNIIGTFKNDWLDIPATDQPTWLRYAAHFLIENRKIVKAWYFFDIIDILRQAGINMIPNRGMEIVPPAPMTGDGIITYKTEESEGVKSLDLTNAMLDGLGSYDGKTLDSMGQERFWDVKNMMWYGPSGIGTTRGLKGFQKNHQVPFITAFPDRGITPKKDNDYFTQLGEGNYSCDFGFPAMYGTHKNGGWLGLEPTGKEITLRVVDYWRREGETLKENWVFIDIPHVLKQLGFDVFEKLKELKSE